MEKKAHLLRVKILLDLTRATRASFSELSHFPMAGGRLELAIGLVSLNANSERESIWSIPTKSVHGMFRPITRRKDC